MAPRLAVVLAILCILTGRLDAASTPAGRCTAAKLKAANKKATAKLKCNQKAFAKGRAVDLGCLSRAELRFQAAFAKAEVNGGCATTGDAQSVEGMVDAFVSGVVTSLAGPSGSTTTTTTTPGRAPTLTTGSSTTATVTTSPVPTTAPSGSTTTASRPSSSSATTGSSTTATTASTTSATTASSTTVTTTSTTVTFTLVTILPCGGIAPACSGTCPVGQVCTGVFFCSCM